MAEKIVLKGRAKVTDNAAEEDEESSKPAQRRIVNKRYLLQVDRQTKSSFASHDEAAASGRQIKAKFPILQVSVYDSVDSQTTVL
jgi:hypothetical protein